MNKSLLFILLIFCSVASLSAQRKVTPVESKSSKLQTVEGKQAAKQLLDKKISPHLVLGDSLIVIEDEAPVDTTPKMKLTYPLFHD